MSLLLTALAQEDLQHWDNNDQLIAATIRHVLGALEQGKTLPAQQMRRLKFRDIFLVSIKIAPEHRLIFEAVGSDIIVHQCRFHY